ncbi:MAG: endolytic transglycosylase MltG, partial [Actinobacteria bacterium]
GSSTAKVGEALAAAGVVPNVNMFRLRARLAKADGTLKAGVYDLKTGMPYEIAIEALQAGPTIKYVTFVVPEGFTVDQIAARAEKTLGIPQEEFLKLAKGQAATFAPGHPYLKDAYQGSLEGYLFPKTYRVKEGSKAQDVIEMMLTQFDKEIAQVDLSAAEARGMTLPQLVTLASMIEKEAKVAEERPVVSSVIYNRLRKNMRLEIDATIQYVLLRQHFRLSYGQTKIDSPYNTYRHKGLPPGPISNPGLASLDAAAHPAKTGYLYYVLTGKDGSHTFATNLQDFLAAKRKSKEVFGK